MAAAVPPSTSSRTAWAVWTVAVAAYVAAVMQRTTLGVAGLAATRHFAITPIVLSAFVFVQVVVYVSAQIPAGLLVDRFGSRAMLVVSGALLVAGQLLLATVSAVPLAVLARVLVGTGDAIVFGAVLALIPRWFPARRVPVLSQLATILGQIGQVLSAVPFLAVLHAAGWSVAFMGAAAVSVLVAVLVLVVVRNAPVDASGTGWVPAPPVPGREILAQVAAVWRRPGTRMGFFGHMGTQFSMMVFGLLWGVPFLASAEGLSSAQAGGLITLLVGCAVVIGPLLGVLTMRHPLRRSWLLLGVITANVVAWTVVLAVPGPAPLWLLVALIVVLAADGPGSMVGIDVARTSNPTSSTGVAQSIVNVGGFLATLVVLALMGGLLTALGGYTLAAFRVAWLVQYPVWALAVVGLLVNRRRARRLDAERGVVPRPLREVLAGVLR